MVPHHAQSQNPKYNPPLGYPADAVQQVFPAQVTVRSLARVPEINLDALVDKGMQTGHIVRFRIDAQQVSYLHGDEPFVNQFLEGLFSRSRLGYVVVCGAILSEHCGDELDHYKREYKAQVVVPLIEPTPSSGFLPGSFRLITRQQEEQFGALHEKLEEF